MVAKKQKVGRSIVFSALFFCGFFHVCCLVSSRSLVCSRPKAFGISTVDGKCVLLSSTEENT